MDNPFSNLDDSKLMELYKKGENMAFEVIYQRYGHKVYTYLIRRLKEKNIVDDVHQSVFVKFHKSRNLYLAKYPLLQWIYTISRSELLDHYKKNKMTFLPLEEDQLNLAKDEIDAEIDIDSFKNLTENERNALKLRYYSDHDFKEISDLLKTSEANSRKLVSRGIKKMKLRLLGANK